MHRINAQLIFQRHLTMGNHVAYIMKTMRATLLVAIAKLVKVKVTAPAKRIIA